jgi:hypothetical protein
MSFEGGIVSINIDPKTMEALTSWDTAQEAYKRADGGSASWIYDPLKNIPWTKPQSTSLDILILNHGETTPTQRDTLVATMNVADYRPLTLAELMALGITRPDLNKQNEYLVTYEEHTLGGGSRVPYLVWNGGLRNLNADIASDGWDEHDRFLFVRK